VVSFDIDSAATGAAGLDIYIALENSGSGGGGGGSITVEEEDGDPSVSDVDTIKVTNGTLTDNGDGSVSIEIGGSSNNYYDPDVIPSSPSSYDDEFNDSSIDVSWGVSGSSIVWGGDGEEHYSEDEMPGYIIIQGGIISKTFTPAIDQAFTVAAKMTVSYDARTNESYGKLKIIGQNSNTFVELRIGRYNSNSYTERVIYANNGGGAEASYLEIPFANYVMITHDGAKNFSFFISSSGLEWVCIKKDLALSNITSFATLSIEAESTGDPDVVVIVDFIRYFTEEFHFAIGGLA
jgi:hypothetical protein